MPRRGANCLSTSAACLFILAILVTAFYTHQLHALFAGTETVARGSLRAARLAVELARHSVE